MELSEFAVCIGPVSAHHKICYDLDIIFLEYQNVGTVQTSGVFDPDKNTGLSEICDEFVPCAKGHNRCGDVDFSVYQGIKRRRRRAHADVGNLTDRISLNIVQKLISTGDRLRIHQVRIDRLNLTYVSRSCTAHIRSFVPRQIHTAKESVYLIL